MRRVVVDANVIVSYFLERNASQSDAAEALLQKADAGELEAIMPQFVIFEVTYVLQSQYGYSGSRLAELIRDVLTFPGGRVIDDCPWKRVMELWPDPLPSLGDAAIAAVAVANRYDAVATFDRKLAKRVESLGVSAYW